MFTKEQAEQIKKQLLPQIENLPEENREQIKQHIQSLSEEQLEEFLKQNNIQMSDQGIQQPGNEKPIFESIVNKELPSFIIEETDKALAILELNPLSNGHSLVLPKQKTDVEKIPKSAFTLAQKIAKRIKSKLKADEMKIETFSFQDYPAINIIPIYKDKELKKEKAEEAKLKKLQNKLEIKTRQKRTLKETKSKSENLPEIKFRIP